MTIEELKVLITAETSGLIKEIKKVETQLGGLEKTAKKTDNVFSKLFKGVGFATITAGLLKLGKTAVNTASELQEVQNVVDVAFGSSSKEMDDFASKALHAFGISELSAKKTASAYMAMANGMNIATDTGKKMALNLTGLSGDMASFYNTTQDVARTALDSVFTGETESLKKFGIVMVEANLEAYALSQGITKAYSEMSQAEKVILRYNYVLNATRQAQGDFARTSGNWANQMRLLTEQWRTFLGLIGSAIMTVLTPFLKILNSILGVIISIGLAFKRVFGAFDPNAVDTISGADSSLSDNMKDAEKSAEGISTSMGSAVDASKKIKKNLAGFDELNVLTEPASGTAGGGASVNIPAFDANSIPSIDELIKENVANAQASLDNFFSWIKENWWKLLLGLVAVIGTVGIGKGIINSIKTAIKGAGDLGFSKLVGLKWGLSLSNLAKSITAVFSGMAGTISGVITKIMSSLSGLWNLLLTNPFAQLAVAITAVIGAMTYLYNTNESFKLMIDTLFATLQEYLGLLGEKLLTIWNDVIMPVINALIGEDGLITALMGLIFTLWDQVLAPLLGWLGGVFLTTLISAIITLSGLITGFFDLIMPLLKGLSDYLVEFINFFKNIFTGNFKGALENIKNMWSTVWGSIYSVLKTIWAGIVATISAVLENILAKVQAKIYRITTFFSVMGEKIKFIFTNIPQFIKVAFNTVVGLINGVLGALGNGINAVVDRINSISITIPSWVPWLGGSTFSPNLRRISVPSIPYLASGGLAYGDTLARIGEYSGASANPEVIAPLDKLTNMMIGAFETALINTSGLNGGEYVINLNMDGKQITQKVIKDIKQYEANTGKPVFSY